MRRPRFTYADQVKIDFGVPYIDLAQQQEALAKMSDAELQGVYAEWEQLEWLRDGRPDENGLPRGGDPTKYGWKLDSWDEVIKDWANYSIHVILGGNRSSKSSFMARVCVLLVQIIPEAEIRCYHVDERRSIEDQQTFIWEALPQKYKEMQKVRGRDFSVQYTQSNGFVGDKLILPPQPGYKRGSTIYFGNYNQYRQNSQVTEGFKAHLIWCDEQVPTEMFNTLLLRLTDFRGRIVLTFTTVNGWTPLITRLRGRVKVLKKRWAKLAKRDLPTKEKSLSQPDCIIHYFWTEDNPFVEEDSWRKKLEGRPMSEILSRAYGFPTKSATTVFPKFNKDVHVIPRTELPWYKPYNRDAGPPKFTRYMVLDGAGTRNWFMLWVAVDASGTWWVYREWPDVPGVGEWAEPGPNPGGQRGPGQARTINSEQEYVDLIRKLEQNEKIFERYIDPRFANTPKMIREGMTTPQEALEDLGLVFIPAPGVHEDAGLQLINSLLSYDESRKIDTVNAPRIYICEDCANLIFAIEEYTATQGDKEPTKDPIDALRYLAVAEIDYVEESAPARLRVGGY